MSKDQCRLCHRDLSPDVLVRCREPDCPLTASRSRASIVVLSGLLGIALIVGAVVMAVTWLSRGKPPTEGASGASMGLAASPATSTHASTDAGPSADRDFAATSRRDASGNATGDLSAKGAASPAGADRPIGGEPADPRAATLVQSFSCESRLSSARAWICTHLSLATRDYNLSLQYKSALARSRNAAALRAAHAAWLKKLDALGDEPRGLEKAFDDWRDELSRM
jgi:hypothetical protein